MTLFFRTTEFNLDFTVQTNFIQDLFRTGLIKSNDMLWEVANHGNFTSNKSEDYLTQSNFIMMSQKNESLATPHFTTTDIVN